VEFPALPDAHAVAVLALTVVALFLFTRERIPLETSSLLVIVSLAVGFQIFPYQRLGLVLHPLNFFHGFGHEALIAVCALMVAGHGLVRTGALEPFGRLLARMWGISPAFSLLATLIVGAVLSAFMNNTPIVVLLLPILISVSIRTGIPASGVLMPMGFATLVGGMCTTIGTSTNLLVVAVAASLGLPRFGMLDFALPAAVAGGIGILSLWLVAPRLLPKRDPLLPDASPRIFSARINIPEDSGFAGKTLSDAIKKTGGALKVNRIRRGEETHIVPLPDAILRAGDQLVVRDTPTNLKEFERVLDAHLYAGDLLVDEEHPLTADDQQLAELVVIQGSPVIPGLPAARGARGNPGITGERQVASLGALRGALPAGGVGDASPRPRLRGARQGYRRYHAAPRRRAAGAGSPGSDQQSQTGQRDAGAGRHRRRAAHAKGALCALHHGGDHYVRGLWNHAHCHQRHIRCAADDPHRLPRLA
jgi:di/tricarboxylate transporter